MKTQQLTITKHTAAYWLTKNDHNRRITPSRVSDYTRQMNDGLWMDAGDPIRFSGNFERLLDGQHRLSAFIKSNLDRLNVVVITHLVPDSFMVMDTGARRSASDVLHINNYTNATNLAASAKIAMTLKKGLVSTGVHGVLGLNGASKITTIEISNFIEKNPQILEGVRLSASWYDRSAILRKSEYAAYYFVFAEKDEAAAFAFFDQLSSGLNLTENSPIYQLRRKLEQDKVSAAKLVGKMRQAIIITCWNAYRRGAEMKMIRVNYEADLPQIL